MEKGQAWEIGEHSSRVAEREGGCRFMYVINAKRKLMGREKGERCNRA